MMPSTGSVGLPTVGWGTEASRPFCWWGALIKSRAAPEEYQSAERHSFRCTFRSSHRLVAFPSSTSQTIYPARRTLTTLRKKLAAIYRGNLLPSFELGGDQADFVDSSAAHDVNSASHFFKQHRVVALDESDLFRAVFKDFFDARTQALPSGIFIVDLDLAVFVDLHDYRLVRQSLILLLVRIGLRHKSVHAFGRQRCDDHENDQQHQQNIDQRNDVHFRHRTTLIFTNAHAHCRSPVCFQKVLNLQPARFRSDKYFRLSRRLPAWRRWRSFAVLPSLRQQTELIHARGA